MAGHHGRCEPASRGLLPISSPQGDEKIARIGGPGWRKRVDFFKYPIRTWYLIAYGIGTLFFATAAIVAPSVRMVSGLPLKGVLSHALHELDRSTILQLLLWHR